MKKAFIFIGFVLLSACSNHSNISSFKESTSEDYQSSEEERYLQNEAAKMHATLNEKGLLSRTDASDRLIKDTLSSLLNHNATTDAIDVYIIRSPVINAFATGTNKIYLHSGIFSILENEQQFAALLAHELAHVIDRHNIKSLITRKNAVATAKIANIFTAGLATIPALNAISSHSREQETEADLKAFNMLEAAQYNPRGLIDFLKNVQSISGRTKSNQRVWASHPTNEKRIATLENLSVSHPPIEKSDTSLFDSFRNERIYDNIQMRLRERQFLLAIEDIEILESQSNNENDPTYAYYKGLAHLGKSKFPKYAAKEKSLIEYGTDKKWKKYITDFESQKNDNRQTAKSLLQKATSQDKFAHKAFLKLGEIASIENNVNEATKYYTAFKNASTNEKDKKYATRLIERLNKPKPTKKD